jgi:hypothetical protein
MSMYVELLSAVFTSDRSEAAGPGELLSLARARRAEMLTSTRHVTSSAERHLTNDVSYDCALIRLCASVGIPATPGSFGQPRDERVRLERALMESGIDLADSTQELRGPV